MTLTTVGYGVITAENTAERVGYTLCFVCGAFVWGTLLAEVGEVHKAGYPCPPPLLPQPQPCILTPYLPFYERYWSGNGQQQKMIMSQM